MGRTYLSDQIFDFITSFQWPGRLPGGVQLLEPWKDPVALTVCKSFYDQYYSDHHHRILILGINPGRFGGGQTGIPFTDPVRLETVCGISNPFPKRPELSSDFIYQLITAYGGPTQFYSRYLISSVCPVGFTLDGKNLNYYDLPALQKKIEVLVPDWMARQLEIGIDRKICFCLGEGKNFAFVKRLNSHYHWFEEVIPLAHPRFIMQYRRKQLGTYIDNYLEQLAKV